MMAQAHGAHADRGGHAHDHGQRDHHLSTGRRLSPLGTRLVRGISANVAQTAPDDGGSSAPGPYLRVPFQEVWETALALAKRGAAGRSRRPMTMTASSARKRARLILRRSCRRRGAHRPGCRMGRRGWTCARHRARDSPTWAERATHRPFPAQARQGAGQKAESPEAQCEALDLSGMRLIDFHTHPYLPHDLAPGTWSFIQRISPAVA